MFLQCIPYSCTIRYLTESALGLLQEVLLRAGFKVR